jgi:hypothetical protein
LLFLLFRSAGGAVGFHHVDGEAGLGFTKRRNESAFGGFNVRSKHSAAA